MGERIFFSKDKLLNSKKENVQNSISRITVYEELWERMQRDRNEEGEDALVTERLADFRRLKQSCNHVSSPQEDPDDQPLGVEVEPAFVMTTTMESRASTTNLGKQQEELSSPQEENHGDKPLGTRVTST